MGGRGRVPKPTSTRAMGGRGRFAIIEVEPTPQPPLPKVKMPDADGKLVAFKWPSRTREWWAEWADHPLSEEFTSSDWSFLLDTALLHARMWNGETKLAPEIRLRVAKFGTTPEDRARLRIQFASAERVESKRRPVIATTEADPREILRNPQ